MKNKHIQSLTLIFGTLLTVAIVCSQLSYFQGSTFQKKEVKTEEQQKEQTGDEAFIAMPSFSLPSYVTFQLTLESYCLFEIVFEDQHQENRSSEIPLHPEKFLQTLFSVIISPNAP